MAAKSNGGTYTTSIADSAAFVDLRSDTVTKPCEEMRRIIAEAEVGDDVYGEDPAVNRLQEKCAKVFGKEAALFVCSGTMGNLLAMLSHCERGDEIIVGRQAHIHRWEQGNYAQFGGISASTVNVQPDGTLPLEEIDEVIRGNDAHMPRTRLICVENTHNYAGGKALPLEYLRKVRSLADAHGLLVHMDGARVFNAAVAIGVSVAEIAAQADSLMMCFSKGLGAPVGSILVGSEEFIRKAHRRRKALGGGWRQAGILAAAAEWSLEHAEETTRVDHARARRLARAINEAIPEQHHHRLRAVEENITNMVLVCCGGDVTTTRVTTTLREHGVLGMAFDATRVRLVLNRGVDDAGVDQAIEAFKALAATL